MKIRAIALGVFFIVTAIFEYSVTPMMLDKVNDVTNNLESSMIPTMTTNPQNQAYASMLSDLTTKTSQLTSGVTTVEKSVTSFTTWASALTGVGLVSYGIISKNNKVKIDNSDALNILKKRLAMGEITKDQFDHLKNDVA